MCELLGDLDARTVLEIGAGQGSLGVLLAAQFDYVGIEIDREAFSTARLRFSRYRIDPERLLFGGLEQVAGRAFDLVCAFEVLEHFEDDLGAVREWRGSVAPGGCMLLSVPAGPSRFRAADLKAGHFRRYSREDMYKLLSEAGFADVRVLNYGFPVGYVLERARNLLARRELGRSATYDERTRASGRWLQPPDWAARVTRSAALPFSELQRPFMRKDLGTGLVALGRLHDG